MRSSAKKILVAVDGSDSAFETVRYLGRLSPFQAGGIVLFHVYDKVPESYWDMENVHAFGWRVKEVRAWEREHLRTMEEYLDRAKKILWRTGFPKDTVHVTIQERKKGISRDIIEEARKGYGCVVVGRKGAGMLRELMLGSVSFKLTQRMDFVPLIVVGKRPRSHSLLLAMDGSESGMRAADSVGDLLGGSNMEVEMVHVVRGEHKDYIHMATRRIEPFFKEARSRLTAAGFGPNQITSKVITGASSRAGALLKEARDGRYGTIVMGKKGLSATKEFLMGRVSNKVLQMAKGHAVWLVA